MKLLNKGFTLIELIMMIVVLSILAAFALPRLFDFSKDSRIATIKGIGASVKSAASIAHSNCMVDPGCDHSSPSSSTTLEGQTISMQYGYPTANASGIGLAVQVESDQITTTIELMSGWNWTIMYVYSIQDNCKVRYVHQTVEIITTGC